jgi:membrane-associated protein
MKPQQTLHKLSNELLATEKRWSSKGGCLFYLAPLQPLSRVAVYALFVFIHLPPDFLLTGAHRHAGSTNLYQNLMAEIIDFILHTDKYLLEWVAIYGAWIYALLFLIIFGETGFVVLPFLPGDGFIFTVGVIASTGALNIWVAVVLMIIAAFLGNTVNYHIGLYLSRKVIDVGKIRWINKSYLDQTHEFFEKHGQKAVILSRFLPVFRTFVPFVAGLSKMTRSKFLNYTFWGGFAWVVSFSALGYFFGQIEWVQKNISLIVFFLIVITIIPVITTAIKARIKSKEAKAGNPSS